MTSDYLKVLASETKARQGASLAAARALLGLSQARFSERLQALVPGETATPNKAMVSRWERGEKDISVEYRALIFRLFMKWEATQVELSRRDLLGQALGLAILTPFEAAPRHWTPSPAEAAQHYMTYAVLLIDNLCNLQRQGVVEATDLRPEQTAYLKTRAHAAIEILESSLLVALLLALPDQGCTDGAATGARKYLTELTALLRRLVIHTYPSAGKPWPRRPEDGKENLHDLWHEANDVRGLAFKSLRRELKIDTTPMPGSP